MMTPRPEPVTPAPPSCHQWGRWRCWWRVASWWQHRGWGGCWTLWRYGAASPGSGDMVQSMLMTILSDGFFEQPLNVYCICTPSNIYPIIRLPDPLFGGAMLQLSGQPMLLGKLNKWIFNIFYYILFFALGGRYEDRKGLQQTSKTYLYQVTDPFAD